MFAGAKLYFVWEYKDNWPPDDVDVFSLGTAKLATKSLVRQGFFPTVHMVPAGSFLQIRGGLVYAELVLQDSGHIQVVCFSMHFLFTSPFCVTQVFFALALLNLIYMLLLCSCFFLAVSVCVQTLSLLRPMMFKKVCDLLETRLSMQHSRVNDADDSQSLQQLDNLKK
jgi:hypothetical protein